MAARSAIRRADTWLPLGMMPLAAGNSSRAFAERMLSKRLLICPPVLSAANSPPMWLVGTFGGLQCSILPSWSHWARYPHHVNSRNKLLANKKDLCLEGLPACIPLPMYGCSVVLGSFRIQLQLLVGTHMHSPQLWVLHRQPSGVLAD